MNADELLLERNARNRVRAINHNQQPVSLDASTPQQLAQAYVKEVAKIYEIDESQLANLSLSPEKRLIEEEASFRLLQEKSSPGSAVVSFVQTYFGLPVRYAGLDVVMMTQPLRVLSSSATFHHEIEVKRPRAANVTRLSAFSADGLHRTLLPRRGRAASKVKPVINSTKLVVFKYDAANRQFKPDPKAPRESGGRKLFEPPTLPLPPVARGVEDGDFRVALETYFTLAVPNYGSINWLALIDVETGSVLHLEALIDGATGYVFLTDPVTKSGNSANGPSSTAATLNGFRDSVTLLDLNAPSSGTQSLSGTRVSVSSTAATPPTEASPYSFQYDSRTDNFSAVNAYNHCNRFFKMLSDMGFVQSSYFDGTTFPVTTNHRFGNTVNASCAANGTGNGIGAVNFQLADTTDMVHPLGSACDWRTVLHEIGGHGILYDHVNSANLGFAHSQGDSLAAILNDPESAITGTDRFITFPFTLFWDDDIVTRRPDRAVASGWGWGGTNDNYTSSIYKGYKSEQVLSTTLFRLYRSMGGDAAHVNQRLFASRFASYLIFKAVGLLTPTSAAAVAKTTQTDYGPVTDYERKLESADAPNWTSVDPAETHAGGAYYKVIRWAFEKQGLFRAAGDPVTSVGRPPAVDVYIDDGRHGEYDYQPNHWSCQDIWNRIASDGGTTHEEPVVGQTNYAYVRVKNRGSQAATNVVVRGYHCYPSAGLTFPDDWQPMTDVLLVAPNIAANDATGVVVGPFQWEPSQVGHECMFFSVYATGDPSNTDGRITSSIPEWRLVPNDNNIGQRNVHPVPGAGGAAPLKAAFERRPFALYNPMGKEARMNLVVSMPDFLQRLGWEIRFLNPGGASFNLRPGIRKDVYLDIKQGQEFTREMVVAAGADNVITVTATADGIVIGGMSYQVDPNMKRSNVDNRGPVGMGPCDIATELLKRAKVEKVKRVRIRKIVVDIDFDDDDCD